MERQEVVTRVRATIVELFEQDEANLNEETRLVEDLGLDSIDALDLAARIEDFTHRRLPEERLRELRTLGDVTDLICAVLDEASVSAAKS